MKQILKKQDLSKIDYRTLNEAFDIVKSGELSPEKKYSNKEKRDTIAIILQYIKKYKIDIKYILSVSSLVKEILNISSDFYDIGIAGEVSKILKSEEKNDSNKLYGYVISEAEDENSHILESYIKAIDNSAIVQIVNRLGIVKYVNEMYRKVSGDERDIIGKNVSGTGGKLYHSNEFWEDLWNTVLSGNIWQGVIENPRMDKKDESYVTYTTITPVKNEDGKIIEFIAIKFDITKAKRLEKELKDTIKRFNDIIDSTSQGFWVINEDLIILDGNESLCILLGYNKEELLGKSIRDFLDDKNKKILDKQVKNVTTSVNRKYHIDFTKKDGTLLPVVLKATSLYDENGNFKEAIAFITDISEIREYEQKLHEISIKDSLTGIWNRRLFDTKLEKYFSEAMEGNREINNLNICLFDIDYFKRINDGLGHDVGDIVLKELGERLLHISKKNIEVFRVGGEEFGVIGTNIDSEDFYKIIEDFRKYNEENPVNHGNGEVHFTVSGGIAEFKKDVQKTPKDLYKKADMLLYAAKNGGRNNIKTINNI